MIYIKNFQLGPGSDKFVEALKIWASGDEAKVAEFFNEVRISHS